MVLHGLHTKRGWLEETHAYARGRIVVNSIFAAILASFLIGLGWQRFRCAKDRVSLGVVVLIIWQIMSAIDIKKRLSTPERFDVDDLQPDPYVYYFVALAGVRRISDVLTFFGAWWWAASYNHFNTPRVAVGKIVATPTDFLCGIFGVFASMSFSYMLAADVRWLDGSNQHLGQLTRLWTSLEVTYLSLLCVLGILMLIAWCNHKSDDKAEIGFGPFLAIRSLCELIVFAQYNVTVDQMDPWAPLARDIVYGATTIMLVWHIVVRDSQKATRDVLLLKMEGELRAYIKGKVEEALAVNPPSVDFTEMLRPLRYDPMSVLGQETRAEWQRHSNQYQQRNKYVLIKTIYTGYATRCADTLEKWDFNDIWREW